MRTLEAGPITLVPQVADHAAEMFTVLSDPSIYRYENAPPASEEALRRRFHLLESRRSADGTEVWLNWVLRLPEGGLIGYVQATVRGDGTAGIAYVLGAPHRGRGLAALAAATMIAELVEAHGVHTVTAVLKRVNAPSVRLLERLEFSLALPDLHARYEVEPDEILMMRRVGPAPRPFTS